MAKPKALFLGNANQFQNVYGPQEIQEIRELAEILGEPQTSDSLKGNSALLSEIEIIFSTWGMPPMDAAFLKAAPKLKTVFYAAGSIKGFVTEESWARGVQVHSAYAANAVPVAEFTVSQVIFCLKKGWQAAAYVKANRGYPKPKFVCPGNLRSTVGVVSLGMIGRMVVDRLRNFDHQLLAYDPFVAPSQAAQWGVELVSLEELFSRSNLVTLHTPWLKETEKMVGEKHFAAMKPGASFLNTSRGAVVDEEALIKVFRERSDLFALLDVTYPEPPPSDSPLYDLPNVVITPHIAGSLDLECRRMAHYMIEEFRLTLAGKSTRWMISKEKAQIMA